MTNDQIADSFSLLSKLMEIHSENSFKAGSYSNAAFNIERLQQPLEYMTDAEISSVKGIGASTAKKVRELLNTGKLEALADLQQQTPAGILDMMDIKGLGPKKIAVIWKELGIESLGELEYACHENRLVTLKGFGAKTQESVLQSIRYIRQNMGYHLWAEAEKYASTLMAQLQQQFPTHLFSLTGSIRRQCEVVEAIEIITDCPGAALLQNNARTADTVMGDDGRVITMATPAQPLVKIYCTDTASFYRQLLVTTGNTEFMAAFEQQYVLPDAPISEEEIFKMNNLPYVHPALRKTEGVLHRSPLPKLIMPGDIRGIIHSHSNWSDGAATLEQMAMTARDMGLEYLVISDHSQSAFYANGLKADRVAAQHLEVDALNEKLAPFRIFKSIESDILNDGSLDYPDSVLSTFDLVIASVHSNLKMTEEKAMERLLKAISNPHTTILGHPTGRLLLSRKGYPVDHKKLIDACVAHGVAIEINAHPRRLDMDWRWIDYALERGALLSIDPDAHTLAGFRDTYYGVKVAQKGGLEAKNNLSSFTLAEFTSYIANRRKINT